MIDHDDIQYLRHAATGDTRSLALLYDRHSSLLYTTILRIVGVAEEAEDIMHDLFADLPEKAHRYDPQLGRPVAWLLGVARNLAIKRATGLKRRREILADRAADLENTLAGSHQGPNEEIYGDEVNHVRACLETLDSGQRAAVDLAFYGGLTHTEIATHTGSPLGTIKARIRRALLQLKSCVENKLNL